MTASLLLQFLPAIDELRRPAEVTAEFETVLQRCGFDFHGVFRRHRSAGEMTHPVLSARWPAGWGETYVERKYVLIDPTVRYLGRSRHGFRWQEALAAFAGDPHRKRMDRMMVEARIFGLKDGYIFPVHGRTGLLGFLSIGGQQVSLTSMEMTLFEGLAKKIFLKLSDLAAPQDARCDAVADVQVTRRELEVLQHLAEGMTSNEISAELGLSRHTVDWYMSALQDKLQARNRHHAVAVAFRMGLVS